MTRIFLYALLIMFAATAAFAQPDPEARPFDSSANAQRDLDSALASNDDRNIIVILGANWCHDSRALAGWLTKPRFTEMLRDRYKTVYVDVGSPQTGQGRNLDIAKRFGIKKVKGTPLVMIVSPTGMLMNSRQDANSWRNAASRSEDEIFAYFADFKPAKVRR